MKKSTLSPPKKASITIPKDKAVFWMDGRGRWHNRYGPFEHKKIIAHFNASIQKDGNGYYVAQEHNGLVEKVYFDYEDTALFVVDIVWSDPISLILNTSAQIVLQPDALFTTGDHLYMYNGDDRIKFAERALVEISRWIEHRKGFYYFRLGDQCFRIGEV